MESRRSSLPFAREGLEETFIHFVQTVLIDLKHLEGGNRGSSGGGPLGTGERVITNPAEEVVCDAWGASATPSDFWGGLWLEFNFQERSGALHDGRKIFDRVVVESVGDAESGAKGGTEKARTRSGSNQRKAGKVKANGSGGGALIDDDIDPKIFDGGIEVLFDHFGEAVDFVDEENVALLQSGEETSEVTCFFDGGTGGGADGGVHFGSKNVSERGFAEARGAAEEEVIEGLRAGASGIEEDAESVLEFGLAGEVGQSGGAKGKIDGVAGLGVQLFEGLGGHGKRMAKGGKFESGKVTRYVQ